MANPDKTTTKAFCNVLAQEKGLDPAGYAGVFDTMFLLEQPLPWPRAILFEPTIVPPELTRLVQMYEKMQKDQRPSILPLFIAPDEVYSIPGYRRFIYFTRPSGTFDQFDRQEYLMPEDKVGKIIWALQQTPDEVSNYDSYKVDSVRIRDILVCTHGSVDAACARFGYPLYRYLRDEAAREDVRVWRVNHFGGHVFAPTLMDMPRGDYWAFVDRADGKQIVERAGDIAQLHKRFRGNAALSGSFAQVLEREILMREGWKWLSYQRRSVEVAEVANEDDERLSSATIRIEYQSKDETVRGTYEGYVRVKHHIETIGSTGDENVFPYPQFEVAELKHTS